MLCIFGDKDEIYSFHRAMQDDSKEAQQDEEEEEKEAQEEYEAGEDTELYRQLYAVLQEAAHNSKEQGP